MLETLFGPPHEWPESDLIGVSTEFPTDIVLAGYRCGVFPMPIDGVMGWWSPLQRAHLPLEGVRITRSLRKSARHYVTTVDADLP